MSDQAKRAAASRAVTPEELRDVASRGEDEPWYGPSATFTEALTEADTIERLQREKSELEQQVAALRVDAERVDFIAEKVKKQGWVTFHRDRLLPACGFRKQIDDWREHERKADSARTADAARDS